MGTGQTIDTMCSQKILNENERLLQADHLEWYFSRTNIRNFTKKSQCICVFVGRNPYLHLRSENSRVSASSGECGISFCTHFLSNQKWLREKTRRTRNNTFRWRILKICTFLYHKNMLMDNIYRFFLRDILVPSKRIRRIQKNKSVENWFLESEIWPHSNSGDATQIFHRCSEICYCFPYQSPYHFLNEFLTTNDISTSVPKKSLNVVFTTSGCEQLM